MSIKCKNCNIVKYFTEYNSINVLIKTQKLNENNIMDYLKCDNLLCKECEKITPTQDNKKICTKCNMNKDLNEYYIKNNKVVSYCKMCYKEQIYKILKKKQEQIRKKCYKDLTDEEVLSIYSMYNKKLLKKDIIKLHNEKSNNKITLYSLNKIISTVNINID